MKDTIELQCFWSFTHISDTVALKTFGAKQLHL